MNIKNDLSKMFRDTNLISFEYLNANIKQIDLAAIMDIVAESMFR